MDMYDRIHICTYISLPEGGMNGDKTACLLVTESKQNEN